MQLPEPSVPDRVPVANVDDEVEGQAMAHDGVADEPEVQVAHEARDAAAQAAVDASRLDDGGDGQLPERVDVRGVIVRPTDTLKTLRQACELAGVGKSGGKATVYKRLVSFCARYALEQRQAEHPASVVPQEVTPVKEPSPEEVRVHELTRLPYAPWCTACASHKARSDMRKPADHTRRGMSVLSFDFAFTGREDQGSDKLVSLVIHDRDTGWREAIPIPRRGGADNRAYLASEVTRLTVMLGHNEILVRSDPEPVCRALATAVIPSRSRLGLRTLADQAPEGEHASNGAAEQAVRNTRLQTGVILSNYESKTGCKVSTKHALHAWATRHASWLLNRFGSRSTGSTPYQDAFNAPYLGKIVAFGQSVLCLCKTTAKGQPKWIQGLWLGKSNNSDQHIAVTAGGKLLLTRSIRQMIPKFDSKLHEVLRDFPWDHPGLLAGSVGRAKPQKPREVEGQGMLEAPADTLGVVSPLLVSIAGEKANAPANDEAASDPTSDAEDESRASSGGNGGAVRADASAPSDERPPAQVQSSAMDVDEPGHAAVESSHQEAVAPSRVHARSDGGASDEFEERPAKAAREEQRKSAKHVPGVNAVLKNVQALGYAHNDLIVNPEFTEDETAVLWEELANTDDDSMETLSVPEELYHPVPSDGMEPVLESSALATLDEQAELFEMRRLESMGVLAPVLESEVTADDRLLSTKHVKTWRLKSTPDGPKYLRRSRFVAREFAALDPERDNLFSPASNTLLTRIIPSLQMHMAHAGWKAFGLDITDAFLTVVQETPTVVLYGGRHYRLRRMLPGQRDGTTKWFAAFSDFLCTECNMEPFAECPALLRSRDLDTALLLHVDDVMGTGRGDKCDTLVERVAGRYQCKVEWLCNPGDELMFLKRTHTLARSDLMTIQPHGKHVIKLLELYGLEGRKAKCTPMPSTVPVDAKLLDAAEHAKYRAAVGILLYLSPDIIECQNAVRVLAQSMSAPTVGSLKMLKHLILYLSGTVDHALGFATPVPGSGLIARSKVGAHVLELFTDSDWSGCKETRRSTSSTVILFNKHVIASASRTLKTISLSSCEAEYHAYVSGLADMIFVHAALSFLLDVDIERHTFLDSSAARGLLSRQGVGKVRHMSGKLLWCQDLHKSKWMEVHAVDTSLNVADMGTKGLQAERIRGLLAMLNVRDLKNGLSLYGEADLQEIHDRIALRKQVRVLQRQTQVRSRPGILATALKIAVVLSEFDGAVSASVNALDQCVSLSVPTESMFGPFATCVLRAAILFIVVFAASTLQGCDSQLVADQVVVVELWIYRVIEWLTENPRFGFSLFIIGLIVPWLIVIVFVACCCSRRPTSMHHRVSTADARVAQSGAAGSCDGEPPSVEDSRSAASACSPMQNAVRSCEQPGMPVPKAKQVPKIKTTSKAKARAKPVARLLPDSETHVYTTARRGQKYHMRRACVGLNQAEEIVRIGIAEARQRNYEPCRICCSRNP